MANISNFISAAGSGGGGGGSLTNTYAAFHVNPGTATKVFTSTSTVTVSGTRVTVPGITIPIEYVPWRQADMIVGSAITVSINGATAHTGTFVQVSPFIMEFTSAALANSFATEANAITGTRTYTFNQTNAAFTIPATTGYTPGTGLYVHPEGGTYLRTGERIASASYPNASITETALSLTTFQTGLPAIPTNSSQAKFIRTGANSISLVEWVTGSAISATNRNYVITANAITAGARITETPYTRTNGVWTAGTSRNMNITSLSAYTISSGNVRVLDVDYNISDNRWYFLTIANNETQGSGQSTFRIQRTAANANFDTTTFDGINVFQIRRFPGDTNTGASFNTSLNYTIKTSETNSGFFVEGAVGGFSTNRWIFRSASAGVSTASVVTIGGSYGTVNSSNRDGGSYVRYIPPSGTSNSLNSSLTGDAAGYVYQVGALSVTTRRATQETTINNVNGPGEVTIIEFPSTLVQRLNNTGGYSFYDGTNYNALISSDSITPANVGRSTIFNAASDVSLSTFVGDTTVRNVESTDGTPILGQLAGLNGNLAQLVFYKIG